MNLSSSKRRGILMCEDGKLMVCGQSVTPNRDYLRDELFGLTFNA